ncbi:hypothetical protein C8Q76DRAFT_763420, partial [Earliella scabrosa]
LGACGAGPVQGSRAQRTSTEAGPGLARSSTSTLLAQTLRSGARDPMSAYADVALGPMTRAHTSDRAGKGSH